MDGQVLVLTDSEGATTRISLPGVFETQVYKGAAPPDTVAEVLLPHPRTVEQGEEALSRRHIVLADLDGDGVNEAVVLTESSRPATSGLLLAIRADGTLLWPPVAFGKGLKVRNRRGIGLLEGLKVAVGDLNGDGSPEIVALLNERGEDPSILAIVSARGEIQQQYFHLGGLNDFILQDVNGDGRPDVLFCGINRERVNERWEPPPPGAGPKEMEKYRYSGAVAGALRYGEFRTGASVQPHEDFLLDGAPVPQVTGLFYARFPMSDYSIVANEGEGYWNQCDAIWQGADSSLQFIVREQGGIAGKWTNFSEGYPAQPRGGLLEFSPARIHDVQKSVLNELFKKGLIPYSWQDMEKRLTPVILKTK